ncbi:MAG: tetratricopeptide repeat protein [Candidatus Hydrogenedentota bacterium]|uniref:Uncharacterized protein n=1 Tax=Sumerlaea chitinivorans TaxID=2250252 RepID=A0A2Z4Y3C2_SUMC1|nr:hypothetical protein BRCON_0722 [Candidatus Sumerlaea chitinivorans]RMH29436.1 MAG: tetratricopeptide repeat protein [Candidatus Hydrogenedentota bacterium]
MAWEETITEKSGGLLMTDKSDLVNGVQDDSAFEQDLYDAELERYRQVVRENLDEAMRRYGFTLYHSLVHWDNENRLDLEDALLQLEIAEKIGMKPRDAVDYFNFAWTAIHKEDWAKAIRLLKSAVTDDPSFADAWYNLALCLERAGKVDDAKQAWEKFLATAESEDAKKQVEAHLATLAAS